MNPFKAYSSLEKTPMLESSVLAPVAGLTARYGSDFVARALLGMTLIGKDTAEKERAWKNIRDGGSYSSFRNILTGLGIAAGAAYPMLKNWNSKASLGQNLSKYVDRDSFYKKNPEILAQEILDAKTNLPEGVNYSVGEKNDFRSGRTINKYASSSPVSLSAVWEAVYKNRDVRTGVKDLYEKEASSSDYSEEFLKEISDKLFCDGLDKEASNNILNDLQQAKYEFTKPIVPVHQGRQLIQRDPFLNEHNKAQADYILRNTPEGGSGHISGRDIAGSAIKAGVGLVAGLAFGKTMGSLFSMNTQQTKKLSRIGAVAGALLNTGVFSGSDKGDAR